ncbi:MAG: hypothetical protein WCC74_01925 [Minisyncoccia bacterium]
MNQLAIILSGVDVELGVINSWISQLERSIIVDKFVYRVRKLKMFQNLSGAFLITVLVFITSLFLQLVVDISR